MLDIIPDSIDTVTTILFPIFASYKALRTSSPAQLAPWLMYWVILSLFHLVESYLAFILTWIPFYAWLRLFIHLYLVLPGKQGATQIYRTHVEPFLVENETHIDDLISTSHDRLKAAGLQYLKQGIEWVRVNVLNLPPSKPASPPPARGQTYAQALLARFNLPSAQFEAAGAAGDFYAMLSSALQGAVSSNGSREAQVEDLSASGTLVPPDLESHEERLSYIAAQRERLNILLQAFDHEADNVASGRSAGAGAAKQRNTEALKKSRSELDFDKIEHDEAGNDRARKMPAKGGWMDWVWGSSQNLAADLKKTQ